LFFVKQFILKVLVMVYVQVCVKSFHQTCPLRRTDLEEETRVVYFGNYK
jgi:hypothetical protein